ncbi:hypothetical protein Tco_1330166 [Tanacetum coccineum]
MAKTAWDGSKNVGVFMQIKSGNSEGLGELLRDNHQNDSLAIAGRNLFNDEASSSNNTEPKPPTPPQTLHEHSYPTSSGFQNLITVPTKQTGRIVDSRNISLIQNTCTFQGLRTEDPLRHVKHYLSIVDNIQADGATRDTSRLRFFHFSLKGKAAEWLDRIPPTQVTTWERLVSNAGSSTNSLNSASAPSLKKRDGIELKRSHEANECELNNPSKQACLSGGDIYNVPSLLRFYHNDDTSLWGNSKRKEKGEDGPE